MRALLVLLLLSWPAVAEAGVRLDFYSRHQARHFPHAFIVLQGTVDATGEAVDANFGFTPRFVSPAALLGPIAGKVVSGDAAYVARGERHFSMELTDEEYRRVMATIEDWRTRPQPSYHVDRANCVGFVAAVALALGLEAAPEPGTGRKPAAYLQSLHRRNAPLLAARTAPAEPPVVAVATGSTDAGSGATLP